MIGAVTSTSQIHAWREVSASRSSISRFVLQASYRADASLVNCSSRESRDGEKIVITLATTEGLTTIFSAEAVFSSAL